MGWGNCCTISRSRWKHLSFGTTHHWWTGRDECRVVITRTFKEKGRRRTRLLITVLNLLVRVATVESQQQLKLKFIVKMFWGEILGRHWRCTLQQKVLGTWGDSRRHASVLCRSQGHVPEQQWRDRWREKNATYILKTCPIILRTNMPMESSLTNRAPVRSYICLTFLVRCFLARVNPLNLRA